VGFDFKKHLQQYIILRFEGKVNVPTRIFGIFLRAYARAGNKKRKKRADLCNIPLDLPKKMLYNQMSKTFGRTL